MHAWPTPQVPQLPGTLQNLQIRDAISSLPSPVPESDGLVGIYTCGITPYDATHMGHAATYVHIDVFKRALLDSGLRVLHTQNITDIDDPLLERASATNVDWEDLASDQIALFAADMTALGVIPPDTYLGAVETIPLIVPAIEEMVAKGVAYPISAPDAATPNSVDYYADVSADPQFTASFALDDPELTELFAQRGGDPHLAGKRNALDPLLWRASRVGEPHWPGGSLGAGRPGWHVECAVIAHQGLGQNFQVQTGGSDLAFPHHAMSCSHSRLLYAGLTPSLHLHTGMVGLSGEKMSKSLGNLVLVSKLLEQGIEPMAIRLAILGQRYASDWQWEPRLLERAVAQLDTWIRACSGNGGAPTSGLLQQLREALADDLDTPTALAAMDEWARQTLAGDDREEGAPGIASRAVNALLGVRF